MKESEELKSARTKYLSKLTKYGALPMPATAHYTAGYKDGSNILWAVAQTCAEAESRFEESQADNAALKEQVEELDATVTVLEANQRDMQETIAQQAEALRVKDEALQHYMDYGVIESSYYKIRSALAIQPNPDILRERDARLVERINRHLLDIGDNCSDDPLQHIANQIRNGEINV